MSKKKKPMHSIGKKAAIKFHDSKKWETMSDLEKVKMQLYIQELCMPWSVYRQAVEKVLGRPVWTRELASVGSLHAEFENKSKKPTLQEIIELIPKEKVVAKIVV